MSFLFYFGLIRVSPAKAEMLRETRQARRCKKACKPAKGWSVKLPEGSGHGTF
jgi:hypothetical protein